jgi:hypothetical protein
LKGVWWKSESLDANKVSLTSLMVAITLNNEFSNETIIYHGGVWRPLKMQLFVGFSQEKKQDLLIILILHLQSHVWAIEVLGHNLQPFEPWIKH